MNKKQREGVAMAIGGVLLAPFCIAMQYYCSTSGNHNGFPSLIPIPIGIGLFAVGIGLCMWTYGKND